MSLLNSAVPIAEALKNPEVTEEEKRKLILAGKAREFAEAKLHLKKTKNYTKFVKLNRSHVSYVVSASPKWELKAHTWWFPIVGSIPYKGFFNEDDAKEEAENLRQKNLDVYMRGVSAYSTLGWFNDPLLSSMLRYEDHDLVNTIIHETVHATLYIKSSADFNERMAVFLGNLGAEMFYQEQNDAKTLQAIKDDNNNDKIMSGFISKEISDIEEWYKTNKSLDEGVREKRLKEIQERFVKNIKPKMKGPTRFDTVILNNAFLLSYKTYMQDLSDFEKLFNLVGRDFQKFLEECKALEKVEKPEVGLKDRIKALSGS